MKARKPKAPGSEPAATLSVRVQPRASRSEITGWREGVLQVRLTAPPVEGAANAACIQTLADALGVPRSTITLVSGAQSREKRFRIAGLSDEEMLLRLPPQ